MKIAWFGKHFGEEPPLVGDSRQGAGGIFFSGCHLRCIFCQNYKISQQGLGKEYSVSELVQIMLRLQQEGAINIDLVTPTLWWKPIREAIIEARKQELRLPVVWNSNAYESVPMLEALEDVVDIYLPDFKYGIESVGERFSGVKNYPDMALKAIREMARQKGPLVVTNGLAAKGVIVRHMILPNNLENTRAALELLAPLKSDFTIALMSQYFPLHKALEIPELNRRLTPKEWQNAYDALEQLGFENGWVQELESAPCLVPDFKKENPF
ncbi:radical SAM protein [Candidatus Peregrinibacteria bacterium]|nr:radical SAM protein [Candidatus Peregrinibacteria bacterium]